MTSIRGGVEKGSLHKLIQTHNCVWFLPHNFLSACSWGHLGEAEYAYMWLKVWRDVSLSSDNFICFVCWGRWRMRKRSTYRVSTLWVHGQRRDAGLMANALTLRTAAIPSLPGDWAPDWAREPGSVLSEPQKTVSASDKESSKNRSPYFTLGLDFPPEIPDVPLCYRPTDQENGRSREFRSITSSSP